MMAAGPYCPKCGSDYLYFVMAGVFSCGTCGGFRTYGELDKEPKDPAHRKQQSTKEDL